MKEHIIPVLAPANPCPSSLGHLPRDFFDTADRLRTLLGFERLVAWQSRTLLSLLEDYDNSSPFLPDFSPDELEEMRQYIRADAAAHIVAIDAAAREMLVMLGKAGLPTVVCRPLDFAKAVAGNVVINYHQKYGDRDISRAILELWEGWK